MPPYPSLFRLIGNTPLIPLHFEPEGLTIWAKCEFTNPSGSIKDRLALAVLSDARSCGLLRLNSTILECSSGNTGISLAMVAAAWGYRVKIVMADTASIERRRIIRQFGGEVVLFRPEEGYLTGIELIARMALDGSGDYFLPQQFANPLNAQDHAEHTGPEILNQMDGRVDAFVAGYGTGGTLSGVGRALREKNPRSQIIAMEPAEAAMLAGADPCCHAIEGVAGGFVPPLLREAHLDGHEPVSSMDALAMTRRLSNEFGLLVGTSSGANVCAALTVARRLGREARVVTVLPDRAERYYSTALFGPDPSEMEAEEACPTL